MIWSHASSEEVHFARDNSTLVPILTLIPGAMRLDQHIVFGKRRIGIMRHWKRATDAISALNGWYCTGVISYFRLFGLFGIVACRANSGRRSDMAQGEGGTAGGGRK